MMDAVDAILLFIDRFIAARDPSKVGNMGPQCAAVKGELEALITRLQKKSQAEPGH